jgi:hypothetical protein
MDLVRFSAILEAYGGNPERWPADERQAAEAFAAKNPDVAASLVGEARALDAALNQAQALDAANYDLLAARVLRQKPAPALFDRRALAALAACAVLGVLAGYSGALLAPPSDFGFDLAAVFAAPGSGEGG